MHSYNFIPYAKQDRPRSRHKFDGATVTKNQIYLSKQLLTKHNLYHFSYVELAYDEQNKSIGIIFIKYPTTNTLKLSDNNESGKSFSVKGFIKANNIDIKKYKGYHQAKKATVLDTEKALIIDLKEKSK